MGFQGKLLMAVARKRFLEELFTGYATHTAGHRTLLELRAAEATHAVRACLKNILHDTGREISSSSSDPPVHFADKA